MTVVCITGMHRSGTSMIARMLNMCGVYLGRDEDVLFQNDYNSEGYWEHYRIVEFNDDILWHLNGGWDFPPEPGLIEEGSRIPLQYRRRAQKLIGEMNSNAIWGWKDPRNALTFPYWQKLIPNVKVVLCVRNPVEVALSLAKRGFSSIAFSGHLWKTYNERALSYVPDENLIVTHYDSFFIDPASELRKILTFLGMSADQRAISEAVSTLRSNMKHNRSEPAELLNFPAPDEIIDLYGDLCKRAGIPFERPKASKSREGMIDRVFKLSEKYRKIVSDRSRDADAS